jgi:hypothetical protein
MRGRQLGVQGIELRLQGFAQDFKLWVHLFDSKPHRDSHLPTDTADPLLRVLHRLGAHIRHQSIALGILQPRTALICPQRPFQQCCDMPHITRGLSFCRPGPTCSIQDAAICDVYAGQGVAGGRFADTTGALQKFAGNDNELVVRRDAQSHAALDALDDCEDPDDIRHACNSTRQWV